MTVAKMQFEIVLPPLYPLQRDVADAQERFRVVACGRRWGKTRLAVLLAIRELLENSGSVMWVAPTHDKTMIGWRLAERVAQQIPGITIRRGDNRIEAPGAGWIKFYSADAEGGLRGEGASMVIVDEAAHIRDLEDIWNQELRPALSDRQGRGVFISTPLGHNFFYQLFNRSDGESWRSWQYPTWSNPYVSKDEIEQARRELPALVFRQEYGAEFVQLDGAMFRREMFRVLPPGGVPPIRRAVRHWDIAASAKNYSDYSVGAKIGLTDDGMVVVLDVVRGRWEWPALLRIIRDTALSDGGAVQQSVESVGVQRGLIDLLSAEPALSGIALRAIEPVGDKIMRAQPVLARAEQGKLALVAGAWNAALIDEFCAFPGGEHDDQVDAVSGGMVALGRSSGGIYV